MHHPHRALELSVHSPCPAPLSTGWLWMAATLTAALFCCTPATQPGSPIEPDGDGPRETTAPASDPATFELLCRGDALGVFQVESSGMRELLTKLRPSSLDDVVALVALYRPGPLNSGMVDDFIDRKHGRKAVEYPLPEGTPFVNGLLRKKDSVM